MANRGGGQVREEWIVAAYSRIALVDEWVRQGHSLIVIVPRLHPIEYGFDLTKHEIFSGIKFSTASGGSIEYCGPTEAKPLLGLFIGHLRYQSILEGEDLIALMRVHRARAGREQIVSGFRRHGAGSMIFVPPFEHSHASERVRYVAALAKLPPKLTASRPILPEWTEYFWTADEAAAQRAISSAEATIAELQAEIASRRNAIAELASVKQLLAGMGDPFKIAVAAALSELGLRVVDGPHPRADLLVSDGTRLGAVEAKGLDGSARETICVRLSGGPLK